MSNSDTAMTPAPAPEPALPGWMTILLCAFVVGMANQVKIPVAGGRVGPADLAAGLAFAGLLATFVLAYVKDRTLWRVPYPGALLAALVLYGLAAAGARSGPAGAVETMQRFEQFFCGFLLFSVLLQRHPRAAAAAVAAGLILNLGAATVQALRFGYGSFLAPLDVKELPWGIGGAYGGLFRDRVSLSFYLAVVAAGLQPAVMTRVRSTRSAVVCALGTALVLGFIAHGQILLIACVVLILAGLLHSRRAAAVNLAAVALAVAALAWTGPGRRDAVGQTLSPLKPGQGEVKTCHLELVAALRMAAAAPLAGAGAGRYQDFIGRCYREIPNPNRNDIETDTQSGLGILLGTVGFPAGLAFLLVTLAAMAGGIESFFRSGKTSPLALGSASALAVLTLCLPISDPFTRGLAWCYSLALAGAWVTGAGAVKRPLSLNMDWRGIVATGMMFTAIAALTAVLPTGDALAGAGRAAIRPAPARPTGGKTAGPRPSGVGTKVDFFRVIDASDAAEVTAPFVKGEDSQAGKGLILRVPDKAGVPPEDGEPDMKYGGAAYVLEVPQAVRAKIWVRAWWEGSCGNTVCLKTDADEKAVTVGNDGTYDAWHWLEAPKVYEFEPGTRTIYLLNREDGIRIDQILVTNDMEYYPQGIEEE